MGKTPEPILWDISSAAAALDVSPQLAMGLAKRYNLHSLWLAGRVLFLAEDMRKALARFQKTKAWESWAARRRYNRLMSR